MILGGPAWHKVAFNHNRGSLAGPLHAVLTKPRMRPRHNLFPLVTNARSAVGGGGHTRATFRPDSSEHLPPIHKDTASYENHREIGLLRKKSTR